MGLSEKWARYPRWLRIVLVILAVWFVLAVIVFFLGAASDAQAAGPAKTNVAYATASDTASAVTLSASGSSCRTVYRRVTVKNKLGWTLFWIRLGKFWCWRGGKITYHPAPSFSHGVTGFGALMQWQDKGTTDRGTWSAPDGSLSRSWGTALFIRCIHAPILGCVQVGSSSPTAQIYGYGYGAFHF